MWCIFQKAVSDKWTEVTDDGLPNKRGGDEVEQRKQVILSLDGGGTRGYWRVYSSLLIMRSLMKEIERLEQNEIGRNTKKNCPKYLRENSQERQVDRIADRASRRRCYEDIGHEERYSPCHYFDYMAGTSTGGIVAIMLSRLRMSIDDCIDEFVNIGTTLFEPENYIARQWNEKCDDGLEIAIDSIVKRRIDLLPSDMRNHGFESPSWYCKTMVLAIRSDGPCEVPHIFRSYNHPPSYPSDPYERNPGPASSATISEVARATSAAPTYFKHSFEVDGARFQDSGIGMVNNPSVEAFFEVQQLHRQSFEYPILTVSIGTGKPRSQNYGKNTLKRWLATMFCEPTEDEEKSERVHRGMEQLRKEKRSSYARFNPDSCIKTVSDNYLGNRKRSTKDMLNRVEKLTAIYLDAPKVVQERRQLAKVLTQHRRQRLCKECMQQLNAEVNFQP